MQNGHGRESGGCVELGLSKENCSVQLSGRTDVYWDGRLSWIPLNVLLYYDLVGVVNSHVTEMAVTPWPKPPCFTQTSLQGISPIYCEKWSKILTFFILTAKMIDMIPKHIFLVHYRLF